MTTHTGVATAGFLWDSLSENLGDQTIGLTLPRWAVHRGFDRLRPAVIGEPFWEQHRVLVIGGGELLQPAGHGYYDLFRVPGEHVLCAAGTSGPLGDVSYLEEYRLVSVRSTWDRENLSELERPVLTAPCSTVLFPQVAEAVAPPEIGPGRIGVHLSPAAAARPPAELLGALAHLDPARVTFFSFTTYNRDIEVERALAELGGLAPPVVPGSPDEAFALIARFGAVIATSLHAGILAYAAGVPCLSVAYAPKVRAFWNDRGLGHRLLGELAELPGRLELLKPSSVDWEDQLAADRTAAESFLDRTLEELDRALSAPAAPRATAPSWAPSHPRTTHRALMDWHGEFGRRTADRLRYEGEQEQARRHQEELLKALEARGWTAAQLEEHVLHLEQELVTERTAYQELARHADHMDQEIQALARTVQQGEEYARHLAGDLERVQAFAAIVAAEERRLRDYLEELEAQLHWHWDLLRMFPWQRWRALKAGPPRPVRCREKGPGAVEDEEPPSTTAASANLAGR
jgi:hypothetical protein